MPFSPHLRITAIGRLGTSSGEIFAWGVSMHAPADDRVVGLSANDAVWDDVARDVARFHGSPQMRLAPAAVLQVVKVASIGRDGKYAGEPIVVDVPDQPGGDPSGFSGLIAPQTALACSLHTTRRGATGRGRFFLPMPLVDLQGDLRMTVQDARARADVLATFVANLNNQPGIDVLGLQVCVASSRGYNTTVSSVSVGRVIDTMRSRRNSLNEARDLVPVPG